VCTLPHVFDNINLEAKAAYVFDIQKNQVVYENNQNTQLPLASLTKLMTALTAIKLIPTNSKITIKKEFIDYNGDEKGITANESWTLKDLLDFSLITSSNDGMRSVASAIGSQILNSTDYSMGRKEFVTKMNENAKSLGLTQTYYINESGLDEGKVNGGYGSAENIAQLMEYMLKNYPQILEATKYPVTKINSLSKTHTAVNTDTAIEKIPNLIASKTGYTDIAGGNLAVIFDASIGRPIVIVVLGSSENGRFEDVKTLVQASLAYSKE